MSKYYILYTETERNVNTDKHILGNQIKTITCAQLQIEFLARSANLPNGLYILPSVISSSFNLRQIISGSTGLIFTIFSPNERYFREFSPYGPLFLFLSILGKICKVTFIQHPGILKGS